MEACVSSLIAEGTSIKVPSRKNGDGAWHDAATTTTEALQQQIVTNSQQVVPPSPGSEGLHACYAFDELEDLIDQPSVEGSTCDGKAVTRKFDGGEVVWYNSQPQNPTSWWWPAVFFASWETAQRTGLCDSDNAVREQQPIPSEGGVVVCLGKRKVHNVVLNCAEQCYPLIGASNARIPENQGLSGVFELEFQEALQEARAALQNVDEDVPASAPESNAQGGAEKKKRSREGGYVRLNGRVEGRYRPQAKVQLQKGEFTDTAYRGFKNGLFRYEFLQYFDTNEERAQWLTVMKKEFSRCKLEAESIHRATSALLLMDGSKPPHTLAKHFPECDPGHAPEGPKKRIRCTTSKTKRNGPVKAAPQELESAVK